MTRLLLAILPALLLSGPRVFAADRSLYAIGNSLTASILPYSIPGLAGQRGKSFDVGFYTPGGRALDYIVANPALANSGSPVTLDLAFRNFAWTDISMEPYPSATSTLASDIASIESIVGAARAGTSGSARIFIYSAWPSQSTFASSGFASWWRAPGTDNLSQPTVLNHSFATSLHAKLLAIFGATTPVHVIPVGDVLAALDDLILAGRVSGVSDIGQLYTDNDHTGDVGKFIAALTVYATVFRENPEGLIIPAGYIQGDGAAILTPALAEQLESLVWQVVNSDARAGVNSAPVATPQSLSTISSSVLPITLGASDAEGGTLSITVVSAPRHGRLAGQASNVSYIPDQGYQGPDEFSFKANDGWLDSEPATVRITVQLPAATPPVSSGGGVLDPWILGVLVCMLVRAFQLRLTLG